MIIQKDFYDIVNLIEEKKKETYRKVNETMISLYWELGKYLSNKIKSSEWGAKVVESLANFLKEKYPTVKGFNKRGLYRMVQFYETYKDNEIVSPMVTQINWSNNLLILSGTKSMEEKEFYIRMCIKENYSKRELNRQISSGYFFRYMISDGKALPSKEKTINDDDFPNTKILDTYCLEFLDLPSEFKEKDLRKAIMSNLKNFILELGNSFSFVGEEYKVSLENNDYFIDLLFYNREFSCLVAIELKIGEFIPEYISKMDFYLEILDRHYKKEKENPSVGIILCSSKNNVVVEYASSRSSSKTSISEFKTKLIDKELLKNKLKELTIIAEKVNN